LTDILSQNEIDELLAALSKGDVKAEEIKSKDTDRQVKTYDFKRPNKFSKEQLHTLNVIHENFARLLTTYLSAQLRTLVQINVFFVEQMTYNEFISSVPTPTIIGVTGFSPLKGAVIIEINPSISFAIIDRLLGGSGEYNQKPREPTQIENIIIQKVFDRMTTILHDAWEDIVDVNPVLEKLETNSQFIQLVSPNEAVALVTFNAQIGKSEGMINICIPHIVIEPIVTKLSAKVWMSSTKKESERSHSKCLVRKIRNLKAVVKAELGKTKLPVKEFINLKAGDVIQLDKNIMSEIDVFVQERCKFKGKIGIYKNKMAVKITRPVGEEDVPNG
jgi:flagellar motor switch protein FliM